jgi:beta-lactamase family protein
VLIAGYTLSDSQHLERNHPTLSFLVLVLAVLLTTIWIAFQTWFVAGPWQKMPSIEAPFYSDTFNPVFADAGDVAIDALRRHRTQKGFPAITSAVAHNGQLVWQGGAGWQQLTLRQLLSHTAGLPGYRDNTGYAGLFITLCGCRHYDTVRASLEIFDGSDLLFTPGTSFHYSSFDTNLVGAVPAHQQNTTYLEVLQDNVFRPLGLAGGGLVSTSVALARIGNAWLDPNFISETTRNAMWTPQVLANGEVNEQSYALGWRFYQDREINGRTLSYAHHGGVSKGAMSWLVVYPDHGLSIAVNINTHGETFGEFASVEADIREAFLSAVESVSYQAD